MPVRREPPFESQRTPYIPTSTTIAPNRRDLLPIFGYILAGACATMGGTVRYVRTGTTLVTQTGTTARTGRRACRWVRDTSATVRRAGPANTAAGKRGCPTSGSWASGLSCPWPRPRTSTCSSSASSSRSNRPANTASCFSSDTTRRARSSCACRCTAACWNWGSPSEVTIHTIIYKCYIMHIGTGTVFVSLWVGGWGGGNDWRAWIKSRLRLFKIRYKNQR